MQRANLQKIRRAAMRRTQCVNKPFNVMDENTGTGDNMRRNSDNSFKSDNKLKQDKVQGVPMKDIKEFADVLKKANNRWLDDTNDDVELLSSYEYMALFVIKHIHSVQDRR